MNKFLILGFKNATLFRKHKQTSDKIFDGLHNTRDRKNEPEYIEPITYHQVSNVLHVLFGKRPVSNVRHSNYLKDSYIEQKAKDSFIRIDSYKNDKNEYQTEIKHLNKACYNSTNPQSFMNWERSRKLLGDVLFNQFSAVINQVFGVDVTDVSFNDIREKILVTNDIRLYVIFNTLKLKKKKSFYDSFYGNRSKANENVETKITIINGIDSVSKLEGVIVVPISEQDLNIIRNNSGIATILDGGMVYIKDIKESNFINTERMGLTKLSDINTKKQ